MEDSKKYLMALVDMGSNGIRFSISNLAPPTARILPTLFQDRAGISLYDAQYEVTGKKGPIPAPVIQDVVRSLQRFKVVCEDFEVPRGNIHVLATEATRTAENSLEFRDAIKQATGWSVTMLPKEEEGKVGAMGIASSFSSVKGLVMDLGGGSTQITWMIVENGELRTGGARSFPYGAAAMTRRLEDVRSGGTSAEEKELRKELVTSFEGALNDLDIPPELVHHAQENGGYSLYLSGGGFRGWGYLLMSQHRVNPYPIPIINGFQVTTDDFKNINLVQLTASSEDVFRVSSHRASQVPAVAFLIDSLTEAIRNVKDVRFCQGGVREGFLYGLLKPEDLEIDPLETATLPFSTRGGCCSRDLGDLLLSSLPKKNDTTNDATTPAVIFRESLVRAFSHLLFAHSSLPKEGRAAAGLHSTTTGILASAHGVSHPDRALLALLLYERWDGEISPTDEDFLRRLRKMVSPEEVFHTRYLGSVAALVGQIYPAGIIRHGGGKRIAFNSRISVEWKGKPTINLDVYVGTDDHHPMTDENVLRDSIHKIEKVGKKKNWITEKYGDSDPESSYGMKILVQVCRDLD